MRIEPYASIDGKEIDINSIPDRSLTLEQWKMVRANTPGFRALYPKLNDEALLNSVENHLKNISNHDDCTYEYSLANNLVPVMAKRIREGYQRKVFDKVYRYVAIIILINFASKIFLDLTLAHLSPEFRFVFGLIVSMLIFAGIELKGKWWKK